MDEKKSKEQAKTIASLLFALVRRLAVADHDPVGDLPLAQLRVCGILHGGPRPMSALSRDLSVSLSALTQIADRLERADLVQRVAEGSDRRAAQSALDAAGRKDHAAARGGPHGAPCRRPGEPLSQGPQRGAGGLGNVAGRLLGEQWARDSFFNSKGAFMKTFFYLLIPIGVLAIIGVWYTHHVSADAPSKFRTATVTRGDLLATISATGTVEPEEVVDIGAQVVGPIKSLGIDPSDPQKKKTIDYGSVVQVGTVLAIIDDAVYKAQYDQAKATLLHAQADLGELDAHRVQAENEWKRAKSLIDKNAIAQTDYDMDQANYLAALANVEVGKATIEQAKAALDMAKTNLDYCTIKSPVKGVIVDRRINVGQTVVSTMSVSSLFLVAKDLTRIQVWASVNEADIGRIHVGMPVTFTCDAFPKTAFRGAVCQIRLNATMTQNVVTYTVVVVTDNSDGKLLPYLTANLQFQVDDHHGVLIVPNAALRWKPKPEQIAAGSHDSQSGSSGKEHGKQEAANGEAKPAGGQKPGDSQQKAAAKTPKADDRQERGSLWVKEGDFVRPIKVHIVASDGTNSEVTGRELSDGLEVVVGEAVAADQSGDTTNPFAPKLFKGRK